MSQVRSRATPGLPAAFQVCLVVQQPPMSGSGQWGSTSVPKRGCSCQIHVCGMALLKLAGLRGTERRFSPPHGAPALSRYRAVAQLRYLPTHALFNCRKLGRACVPSPNPCPADLAVEPSPSKGYIQAVDKEGRPLCLRCQQPTCQPEQGSKASAWDSRFCSLKCQEEFWIRSNNSYLRAQVFAAEHGVCQLCSVNAQELFLRVRDAPKSQRKNLLDAAWRAKLPLEQVGFHHVSGAVVQSAWMLTNCQFLTVSRYAQRWGE